MRCSLFREARAGARYFLLTDLFRQSPSAVSDFDCSLAPQFEFPSFAVAVSVIPVRKRTKRRRAGWISYVRCSSRKRATTRAPAVWRVCLTTWCPAKSTNFGVWSSVQRKTKIRGSGLANHPFVHHQFDILVLVARRATSETFVAVRSFLRACVLRPFVVHFHHP